MSRFKKLSHVLWRCQYHLVWTPKYRYRILTGPLNKEVHNCVNIFASQLGCGIVDLNIKADHIHLIINVPPKVSKRENSDTGFQAISISQEKALLGKSFLGQRLLCRYHWVRS
jgi:putative transposase